MNIYKDMDYDCKEQVIIHLIFSFMFFACLNVHLKSLHSQLNINLVVMSRLYPIRVQNVKKVILGGYEYVGQTALIYRESIRNFI